MQEQVSTRDLLFAHFFLCSIGLLKIIYVAAYVTYAATPYRQLAASLFYFFSEYSYFREKPAELLQYGFSIIALALYYWLAVYILRYKSDRIEVPEFIRWITSTKWRFGAYLAGIFAINLLVFLRTSPFSSDVAVWLFTFLWLATFSGPPLALFASTLSVAGASAFARWWPLEKKVSACLIVVLFLQISSVFIPYVSGRLDIPNDFFDIPEQTKLGNGYVDNTTYINEHEIGGLNKYDPLKDYGSTPPVRAGASIPLVKSPGLVKFILAREERKFGSDFEKRRDGVKISPREIRYYYDDINGLLVLRGRMTQEERIELTDLAQSEREKELINQLFYLSASAAEASESRRYSVEELQFIKANLLEIPGQVKAGWFFHHHTEVLGPINELALGKPALSLQANYGWLNAVILNHLIQSIGGLSFENYFKVLYFFYPLYLVLFIGVSWVLLRDVRYVLLASILAFSATLGIGEELLRIAPGFNPIRHFLDLFVALGLYFYIARGRLTYLFVSVLLAVLAVACSREFGLFMSAALAATIVAKQFFEKNLRGKEEVFIALFALIGAGLVVVPINPDTSISLLIYSLLGVSAPSISRPKIYLLLLSFSLLYLILIRYFDQLGRNKWVTIFLFLYAQAITIYYVWNPGFHHLLSIAPIWILVCLVLLKTFLENGPLVAHERLVSILFVLGVMIGVYLPSLVSYYTRNYEFKEIFETHKIYDWNFDRAKFRSTMDPSLFQNAVNLIQRHSKENEIYIISKYDTILPFLSARYSALPFRDVKTSLVTEREVQACIRQIRSNRPEYIFVDTDIERNLNGDVWLQEDPLGRRYGFHGESLARVSVLNLLKRVYYGVKDNYEPVEKGFLITVYRRKGLDYN